MTNAQEQDMCSTRKSKHVVHDQPTRVIAQHDANPAPVMEQNAQEAARPVEAPEAWTGPAHEQPYPDGPADSPGQ